MRHKRRVTSETLLTTKTHSNGTDYLTIILQITVRRGWVRVLVGAVPSKSKKSWGDLPHLSSSELSPQSLS